MFQFHYGDMHRLGTDVADVIALIVRGMIPDPLFLAG